MIIHNEKLLILASISPTRKYLFKNAISNILRIPSNLNVTTIKVVNPQIYVKILSFFKAKIVSNYYPYNWVIGIDTIVTIDNKIFKKNHNKFNTMLMLKLLNGKNHQVYTGYTIICKNKNLIKTRIVSTNIKFKELKNIKNKKYLNEFESFDKSGGYTLQGIRSFDIEQMNGSFSNLMGLPMYEVIKDLYKIGINISKGKYTY